MELTPSTRTLQAAVATAHLTLEKKVLADSWLALTPKICAVMGGTGGLERDEPIRVHRRSIVGEGRVVGDGVKGLGVPAVATGT